MLNIDSTKHFVSHDNSNNIQKSPLKRLVEMYFFIIFNRKPFFTNEKQSLITMKLTKEQEQIIASKGDIKINAVAGSGKTTTVIEYAQSRPANSKILYLAFNKSVKLEALKKFASRDIGNVKVETAHSLAYKQIVFRHGYQVRNQGYQIHEIADLLKINSSGEKHNEFILANHILKFMSCFCNSDKQNMNDVNYLETITDKKARSFVFNYQSYIIEQAGIFWEFMSSGKIDITHDFYLKKFQLSNPRLPYDYILFDEGQDASGAMLDVFLKQKATKVIVGDTHQQIYGWRYAVNSLERTKFSSHLLSTSFRFQESIANLANDVLKFKKHLNTYEDLTIHGIGNSTETNSKAIVARTNLGLLIRAIEIVFEEKNIERIYFEGNIHSYTYADEGASLYDVLNLYNSKRYLIKDKLIRSMSDLSELEDYIDKTEDLQLGMMVKIVETYGNEIPGILKKLKEMHVDNDKKDDAQIIFSTVHRCKGMEYDQIELVSDFVTEDQLKKIADSKDKEHFGINKLNEEINLLYVAITRTRNILKIPESLLPKNFSGSANIEVLRELNDLEEESNAENECELDSVNSESEPVKSYSILDVRKTYREAYQPWNDELDSELTMLFFKGIKTKVIAQKFGRTTGAILSRIKKLELREVIN